MTDPAGILSALPDAVVVSDGDGRILGWLGSAERIFGWRPDEVLGQDLDELMKPREANGADSSIVSAAILRNGSANRGSEQELMVHAKDGQMQVAVTSSVEMGPSSGINRVFAVFRDIADRKRIDLAKSEVVSAVSHELRSPLTSIKGFASTLVHRWDRFDDDAKKKMLETINNDADRVTRLIGELLDIARIEGGRMSLRTQPVDVKNIAAGVIARLEPQAPKHTMRLDFFDDFPKVPADADKVGQVLTNLVENAIKYTDGGEITVRGRVEPGWLKVAVLDEGEGIPVEDRAAVFDKFFRRRDHQRRDSSGSGLGLYICKGLVEAHGGAIWVQDPAEGGAGFTFTLPAPH